MSCIKPDNEFGSPKKYKPPVYCPHSNTTVSTTTGCHVWDGAVGAVQCGTSTNNTNPTRAQCQQDMKDLGDDILLSGNWQTSLSQCERIQSDQVCSYGEGDIFDIKQLKQGWSGGPIYDGLTQCSRSLYGAFQANGCKAGTNDDPDEKCPSKCASDTKTSVYDYWQQMKQSCQKTMTDRDKNQGLSGPGSYTDAFQGFSLVSGQDGSSSMVNLAFDCLSPNVSMYTQCKLPGWDMIKTDTNSKGWIADTTNCGKNPLADKVSTPVSCPDTDPTACENKDGTSDGFVKCKENDLRPRDPEPGNTNCCLNCTDWTSQYKTYFSYQEATASKKLNSTETYQSYLKDQCDHDKDGGCCIKKMTTSETTDDEICAACQKSLSNSGKYDMSQSTVTFFSNPNGADNQPLTMHYVDQKDDSGVTTASGIAITPTGGTGAPSATFSDVRECNYGGSVYGQCRGLTGCAGFTGTWDGSNPFAYCIQGYGDCISDNACNHGYDYDGTNTEYTNPATNCPNLFTLNRNVLKGTNSSCDTSTAYDAPPDNTFSLKNLDKMTIPEGAWVTGHYSANAIDGTWNKNICDPGDNDYVVMMGCAQDGTNGLRAYASTFSSDSNGNLTPIKGKATVKVGNTQTLYKSDHIKAQLLGKNGKEAGDTNPAFQCQFSGLSKVEIRATDPDPVPNLDATQSTDAPTTMSYPYMGYTFGFMPGYYSTDYTTSTGPCTNNSTNSN